MAAQMVALWVALLVDKKAATKAYPMAVCLAARMAASMVERSAGAMADWTGPGWVAQKVETWEPLMAHWMGMKSAACLDRHWVVC